MPWRCYCSEGYIMKKENNAIWVIVVVVIASILGLICTSMNAAQREDTKRKCIANGKIYVEESNTCREKTTSEKFAEKCTDGITIDGTKYTCSEIKKKGLEKAFLDKNIVKHGNDIYEYGTYAEVQAGKESGDYCLSASDTWRHIGEVRCVVFRPTYFAYSGRNYFIDEKKDYKNGFVIYMYGNYGWNWFLDTYKNSDNLLVCGTIKMYEGHPEIKAVPSNILTSPKGTTDGSYTVYKYSCH